MKEEDSIFYMLGHDNVQVRLPQTFEEELIYIGPYSEVVNEAMMKVVENLEKIVNTGLRESGIRFEVDARWCNILDSERNPKGEYGFVSVLMHREKQAAMADNLADKEQSKLSREELFGALGKLVKRIEECGGSPELTNAVTLASDIRQAVGNQWNAANEFAAERVREAV